MLLIVFYVFLALLVIALLVPYLFVRFQMKSLASKDLSSVGGEFIRLSHGNTHYHWYGKEHGNIVVLVPGLATPSFVWDNAIDDLVASGNRVLTFDFYGRGFSDRPKITFDEHQFNHQILELLDALDVNEPVDMVGLSHGGGVTTSFVSHYPERVKRVGLVSPTGYIEKDSMIATLTSIPVVGEYLINLFGIYRFTKGFKKAVNAGNLPPVMLDRCRENLMIKGTFEAVLSTIRNYPNGGLEGAYRKVGESGKPVLLIWGTVDDVCPFSESEKVLSMIPNAEFHAIEGAGHSVGYENADVTNPLLVKFLAA